MRLLVLGGARSGKSDFALARAEESAAGGQELVFVATAEAHDQEMIDRIEAHQAQRGPEWVTIEEPIALPEVLLAANPESVFLVDCLTIWLSNRMAEDGDQAEAALDQLARGVKDCPAELILVSNEVGLGIVPDNALARRFRDLSGAMNRKVAEVADEVYFVAAGLPLKMK